MIISASYKTDIPAFYGEWFLNRLNAGYCEMINPYNQNRYHISLKREDVDGFVFWTKNLGPFIDKLDVIHERGYPFVVQYTINGYPRLLETSVANYGYSIKQLKIIADKFGPRVAVWRYDPIIFTSITPIEFHLRNFENFANNLEGATDEVVVSFAQIYEKTLRNINLASKDFDFTWEDPIEEIKLYLASQFADISKDHGMQLTMCSQRRFLAPGIKDAHCVDAHRLSDIAGYRIRAKLKGNRPECGCYESKDIGEYDTCPHGCIYCYAVLNRKLAQKRYKEHDPSGEYLYKTNEHEKLDIIDNILKNKPVQKTLFYKEE